MSNVIYDDNADVEESVSLTHEQYTQHKAMCQEVINQGLAAERLAENKDFKAVIMQAYFEREPLRLTGLIISGRLNPKQMDEVFSDMKSIGNLTSFLREFSNKAQIATDELASLEEAYNEAVESGEAV